MKLGGVGWGERWHFFVLVEWGTAGQNSPVKTVCTTYCMGSLICFRFFLVGWFWWGFLSDLDAAMFQKGKSFFTSAHCEEWDNEMQNQGRAQAFFACLSQALSEEEMPSPGKWLSHF